MFWSVFLVECQIHVAFFFNSKTKSVFPFKKILTSNKAYWACLLAAQTEFMHMLSVVSSVSLHSCQSVQSVLSLNFLTVSYVKIFSWAHQSASLLYYPSSSWKIYAATLMIAGWTASYNHLSSFIDKAWKKKTELLCLNIKYK